MNDAVKTWEFCAPHGLVIKAEQKAAGSLEGEIEAQEALHRGITACLQKETADAGAETTFLTMEQRLAMAKRENVLLVQQCYQMYLQKQKPIPEQKEGKEQREKRIQKEFLENLAQQS